MRGLYISFLCVLLILFLELSPHYSSPPLPTLSPPPLLPLSPAQMDRDGADFGSALRSLKGRLGCTPLAIQMPIMANEAPVGR